MNWAQYFATPLDVVDQPRGGPDFSCFLITKACHDAEPFDERFIPAYCEDNDYHRRLMLSGNGARIFSVNLPYLHYGAATVNADPDPAKLAAWAKRIETARAHYRAKWGGEVNHERYLVPFVLTGQDGVTNPELQAACNAAQAADVKGDVEFERKMMQGDR